MKKKLSVTLLILIVSLIATVPALADSESHPCGMGEVESTLQALPVGFFNVNQSNTTVKIAGLGGGTANCYVPLFRNEETYTYHSSEFVFGGLAILSRYKDSGLSRQEGIDEISSFEERVFLGPVDGELVEVELTQTAFKGMVDKLNHEQIVYQVRGFITQLEPGEYSVYTRFYYQGELDGISQVTIIVEP